MKIPALDSLRFPAPERTMDSAAPRIVRHLNLGTKKIMTKAACQMADLLERQSELLADLGMRHTARQACKEVRQLRLLAALEG